jgi:hypothetical protein
MGQQLNRNSITTEELLGFLGLTVAYLCYCLYDGWRQFRRTERDITENPTLYEKEMESHKK